jgi:rRNA-processing protein FCF1
MSGIVATGDVELRKKARNANIPVVYVRSDLRLAIEGIEPAYG